MTVNDNDKDLYSGLIRLHVLHHACQESIFGAGIIEEMARHGYRLSPGTLYPLLHGLEEKGYLRSSEGGQGRQSRRSYQATPTARRAFAAAKIKVRELFSELLENVEENFEENAQTENTGAKDLMREIALQLQGATLHTLRRGLNNVKEPEARALLETSTAVVEGLIKAFGGYHRRNEGRK